MGDAKKGTKRWDKKLAGNATRQADKTQKAKVAAHVEDQKKKLRNAKKAIAELKAQLDQANREKNKWMRKQKCKFNKCKLNQIITRSNYEK